MKCSRRAGIIQAAYQSRTSQTAYFMFVFPLFVVLDLARPVRDGPVRAGPICQHPPFSLTPFAAERRIAPVPRM
jgi:hypothetical protein